MFFRSKPPPGIVLAGQHIGWPDSGIAATGSSGRGKTFFSREIQRQFIRQGVCMMVLCSKPDEASAIERLCREEGALSRFRNVRPGGPHTYEVMHETTRPPHGSTTLGAYTLEILGDIALGSEGRGQGGDKFWSGGKDSVFTAAIDLDMIANGRVSLDHIKQILLTSPANEEAARADVFFSSPRDKDGNILLDDAGNPQEPGLCAQFFKKALAEDRPETRRRLERCMDVFANEFCSIGPKARGAIMSMVNQTISKLLVEPYFQSFCTPTTLSFEEMDREGLIVALDAPLLVHGPLTGRLFQMTWALGLQSYALRRDARDANRIVLNRDECHGFTHPGHDALVAAQCRSQRLIHFDIFQDFDLMESTYGGGAKARNETMSFYAQHGIKVIFGQDNMDACESHSKLVGMHREVFISGSPCHPVQGDLMAEAMGCKTGMGYSEQYQPIIRPENFAQLDIGQAVIVTNGRHRFHDFRTGRKAKR